MTIKTIQGDLVELAEEGLFDIVVHGCNIENTMFSGIADTIRRRWPDVYRADLATKKGSVDKLGKISYAWVSPEPAADVRFPSFICINAYVQYLGKNSEDGIPLSYKALRDALYQVKLLFDMGGWKPRIGMPKIGSLRAGGDWDKILGIIEKIEFRDLTIVEYDGTFNR